MRSIVYIVIFLVLGSFVSCSQKSSTPQDSNSMRSAISDTAPQQEFDESRKEKKSDDSKNLSEEQPGKPITTDRKIIKNGDISIEVKDLKSAEKTLTDMITFTGGYIAASQLNEGYLTMTARIPVSKFDAFVEKTGSIGKITYKTTNAEDVTEHFFDLQGTIATKKILRERYQSYLRNAKNIDELLKIEREINNVTREIEQLEGSFRVLDNRVEFSTISFTLSLPRSEKISQSLPSFLESLKKLGSNIIWFLHAIVFAIIYLVLYGAVLVVMFGFLYLITFGKIGLVKKLFKSLSSKHKTE